MKDYIEERAVEIANYIIEHNATVRQTAMQFGISVSYQIVQDLDGVHSLNHMEIKIGMMVKVLCHLFKWQMFQTI